MMGMPVPPKYAGKASKKKPILMMPKAEPVKKPKVNWTTYAILKASTGGKEWTVQFSEDGRWRCSCPSFIFSKVKPRACKHTRHCEQQAEYDPAFNAPIISDENMLKIKSKQEAKNIVWKLKQAFNLDPPNHFKEFIDSLYMTDTLVYLERVLEEDIVRFCGNVKMSAASAGPDIAGHAQQGIRRITFDD